MQVERKWEWTGKLTGSVDFKGTCISQELKKTNESACGTVIEIKKAMTLSHRVYLQLGARLFV